MGCVCTLEVEQLFFIKTIKIMKIYSIDDYDYLVQNGCYPDGYVEGLGIVSSQTVTVKSALPNYPNDRALGIDRRTQFISTKKYLLSYL